MAMVSLLAWKERTVAVEVVAVMLEPNVNECLFVWYFDRLDGYIEQATLMNRMFQ